jgi:hypothetical protein
MSPEQAYKSAMTKDPATARRALSAAWENFETSLTLNVVPVLIPALFKLSSGLNMVGDWARRHPNVTKDLVMGLGGLSAVLAVGGPLLTGMALTRVALSGLPGLLTGTAGSIGVMTTGIKLLGSAAAVFAAGYAGWKLGTWANDHVINPAIAKLTGDNNQTLGGWIWDKTHVTSHDGKVPYGSLAPWRMLPGGSAWDGIMNPQNMDTVRSGAQRPIEITVVSKLDEKEIARSVTKVQAREIARPQASASRFDPSMHLIPPSMGMIK